MERAVHQVPAATKSPLNCQSPSANSHGRPWGRSCMDPGNMPHLTHDESMAMTSMKHGPLTKCPAFIPILLVVALICSACSKELDKQRKSIVACQ